MKMSMLKSTLVVLLLSMAAMVVVTSHGMSIHDYDDDEVVQKEFRLFVARYGRSYAGDADEYARRLANFRENFEFIVNHNADATQTYRVGINHFADLSREEYITQYASGFKRTMNAMPVVENETRRAPNPPSNLPNSTDWRLIGGVSPISDQGECGSSPFFGAVTSIEGLRTRVTGDIAIPLSTQQVVSCNKQNDGCNGADYPALFQYIVNHGLETAASYPYNSGSGVTTPCHYNQSAVVFRIGGYSNVTAGDEDEMAVILATNSPIACAVDATLPGFEFYESGIYTTTQCQTDLIDHGIAVVGYGETWVDQDENVMPYWLLKNSWTDQWGEEGFMRIQRGVDMCGVAQYAFYPLP